MLYAFPVENTRDSLPRDLNDVLELFDIAWRSGMRPSIEAFLSWTVAHNYEKGHAARRQLLEELIKIDLEYCWQRPEASSVGQSSSGDVSQPMSTTGAHHPRLEEYVARFPEIGPLEQLPLALVREEYRVRKIWGDNPAHAEYAARFAARGPALSEALARADAELAAEHAPGGSGSLPRSSPRGYLKSAPLFCPHCYHHFELGPDLLPGVHCCPSCGDAFTLDTAGLASSPTAEPLRARVGRYELKKRLGTGAFGSVWLARDMLLDREVAVKLLRSGRWAGPAEEERFLREARATAQLRHEGIVAVHDVGREGEVIYLVADLVEGMSLAERLEQAPLNFREAVELIAYLADTLDYAHRQGVVHRDLKPSNIMMDCGGARRNAGSKVTTEAPGNDQQNSFSNLPKIMDFGLAKSDMEEITLTVDGQVLGTPAYMSPEQIRDPHHVDGRSDVFSLGVILYQLLTGELPFRGVTRMVLQQVQFDEPRPPRRLNDKVPHDLETITLKCLAKEPAHRYATAEALALDARRWLGGAPIHARPVGPLERLGRWCKRKPVLAGLSAALLLVGAAGFAGVTWQWQVAEHNRCVAEESQAQALANVEVANRLRDEAQTRAREEEQERQRIEQEATESRQVVFQALALQNELALSPDVQKPEASEKLAESFLKYNERSLRKRPDDPGLQVMVAGDYYRLGIIKGNRGFRAEALEMFQRGVALQEKITRDYPEYTYLQRNLAHLYTNIGYALAQLSHWSLALEALEKSRAVLERLLQSPLPDSSEVHNELAIYYWHRGNVLSHIGQLSAALCTPEQARDVVSMTLTEDPTAFFFARALGQKDRERGFADSWRGPPLAGTLIVQQPAHLFLSTNGAWVAASEAGLRSYEKARAVWQELFREHPSYVVYQSHLGKALNNIGEVSYQLGRCEEALAAYRQALGHLQKAFGKTSRSDRGMYVKRCYVNLARLQRELGRPAEAAATILDGQKYSEEDAAMLYTGACELTRCMVMISRSLSDEDDAQCRDLADKAVDMLRRALARGLKDPQRLQTDPHLEPLRTREDFLHLQADSEGKQKQ
jgi:tetratricopeptide (TPR) repeat protein/tRNA A-37 threonylcarbamoyl transferase component Bud32